MGKTIPVKIDFSKDKKPMSINYHAFGYANTDFTYTKEFRRMYDYLSSYHVDSVKYMRLHNILTCHGKGDYYFRMGDANNNPHGLFLDEYREKPDIVVTRNKNGELEYNWDVVDKVYDIMLSHGYTPIVETVYIPSAIRKDGIKHNMPEDFNEWREVIKEFVRHLQDRYGSEEIEKWYFEIWNEPDGYPIWREADSDISVFLAMYDYMVDGVLSVNEKLKVGGPAVKQLPTGFNFLPKFLEHCAKGINYATGEWGTRLDFISVHCKAGGVEHGSPSMDEYMFGTLTKFYDVIREYPEYENTEILNDESDIIWCGDVGVKDISWMNFRNTHYFAGFVCKMADTYYGKAMDENGMNITIVDSDNCHLNWETSLFSGNRSQLTPLYKYPSTDLIKKPAFNAYNMLSKLGKHRIIPECNVKEPFDWGFGQRYGVLPTFQKDYIAVMVWNFQDSVEESEGHDLEFQLNVKGVEAGLYNKAVYMIDSEHSSAYNWWERMGKPEKPNLAQIKKLRNHENLELTGSIEQLDIDNQISLEVAVQHHGIALVILSKYNNDNAEYHEIIKQEDEIGAYGNNQIFLKWKPSERKDFLYYRIYRKSADSKEFELLIDDINMNCAVYVDMDVDENKKYDYRIESVSFSNGFNKSNS